MLNNIQEQITKTIYGPVLVIACPGAGKTTTLLYRIQQMLQQGVSEKNILMVTFTKNAAEEMRTRYEQQFNTHTKVTFQTIHSLCLNILRKEGLYSLNDIISEHDAHQFILSQISQGTTYIEDSYDIIKRILNEISLVKNNYFHIDEYEATSCDTEIFQALFRNYQNMLKERHKIDYDEMMLKTQDLLYHNLDILEEWQDKYQFIQCDEYQDTNPIQKDILYLLARKSTNLCVVGDDDQSIYGFRGAKPNIMFDFQQDFPECKTFYMEINYRSTPEIVEISEHLIQHNKSRFQKNLIAAREKQERCAEIYYRDFYNKTEEMDFVIKKIKELHINDIPYSEMAILMRTNQLMDAPIEALFYQKIPFSASEPVKSIYDKWIFKLLCSYLYLSMGKWKQKYINDVITKPNKYLKVKEFQNCPYTQAAFLERIEYLKKDDGDNWQYEIAEQKIKDIFYVFRPGRFKPDSSPVEVIKALEYLGLETLIADRAKKRKEDVEETQLELAALISDATRYRTLSEWFQYAKQHKQFVKTLNEQRSNKDGLQLMTIHAAKGCEWSHVFVIDVTQHILPHRSNEHTEQSIEEERRLLYVAMTRAKNGLYLLNAGTPSMFSEELEDESKSASNANIDKPEIDAMFMNLKYGIGILKGWERNNTMLIQFARNLKKFKFPDAIVDGYLSPLD